MHDDLLTDLIMRCPPLETKSLEVFLDTLLDLDPETLAQLPGSPGQVLCAQFTYYARHATTLVEPLRRNQERSKGLVDALMRLPAAPTKSSKKRKEPTDGDSSDSEAAAGR